MALLLLLSLTAAGAFEDSLLQLQEVKTTATTDATTKSRNTLSGVGAKRYGTWGAQSFKWNVKSKVSKYFMTQEEGHNQTTKGMADLNATEDSTTSSLTTRGGNTSERTGKRIGTTSTETTNVAPTLLQKKADEGKAQIQKLAATLPKASQITTDASGVSKDYTIKDKWNGTNQEIKAEQNIGLDAYMELEEDNQKLTDKEVETPELVSDRDGFVKSNWSSTDKYTTWAAIGILERMIDRATGDPYSRGTDATPPPKGMGFSGHPGKVGVFDKGTEAQIHPQR